MDSELAANPQCEEVENEEGAMSSIRLQRLNIEFSRLRLAELVCFMK